MSAARRCFWTNIRLYSFGFRHRDYHAGFHLPLDVFPKISFLSYFGTQFKQVSMGGTPKFIPRWRGQEKPFSSSSSSLSKLCHTAANCFLFCRFHGLKEKGGRESLSPYKTGLLVSNAAFSLKAASTGEKGVLFPSTECDGIGRGIKNRLSAKSFYLSVSTVVFFWDPG